MDRLTQGSKFLEEGNYEEAVDVFTEIINSSSFDFNVLCLRGVAYRRLDKLVESIADFEKALEMSPNNASILSEIGVTKFHMRDLRGALDCMNKAQELEPQNPYRYSSRAYIKDALKDTEGAIEDYKKTIEIDPDDAVALNNLGMLEEKLGRKNAAKKLYEKADLLSKEEDGAFSTLDPEGGQEIEAQKGKIEVQKVLQENEKKEQITIKEQEQPGTLRVMFSVFTSKKNFKEFITFVRNGFKFKQD